MIENENKNEHENNPKKENNPLNNILYWFIGCFILSFFLNLMMLSGNTATHTQTVLTDAFIAGLADSTYGSVQDETTFRCVNYTPVFTEDGVKQYEVRFRDMNSDLFFNIVVPAKEIDELGNIEKDAKYEGVISYMFVDKAYTEITKDLEGEELNNRMIALLNGESEYAKFGIISDISFMYSEYLDEYSTEKATEYLEGYVDKLVNPPVEETTNKKIPFWGSTSK